MRLFAALLRRRHMPNGNIHSGKDRIVKPVTKEDHSRLRTDFEIEERNMFYLRHTYLTPEQSQGHVKALNRPHPFLKVLTKKRDFPEDIPADKILGHLRHTEAWD